MVRSICKGAHASADAAKSLLTAAVVVVWATCSGSCTEEGYCDIAPGPLQGGFAAHTIVPVHILVG